MRRLTVLALWLGLFLVAAPPVAAHRPLAGSAEGATEIPNIDTSFAVYRDLAAPGQVDRYRFEAQAGEQLHGGINIPAIAGLEGYGVMVALVGPGLPAAGEGSLPIDLPQGEGAMLFPSERSEPFYEPFTQTNYWGRQQIEVDLPETGRYELLVWNAEGEPGKYVLDTGTAEVFGPADLLRFPLWWVQVHAFFGHTPFLVAGAVALAALGGVLLWWRHRSAGESGSPRAEHAARQAGSSWS